jgi:rare lipoprotein A
MKKLLLICLTCKGLTAALVAQETDSIQLNKSRKVAAVQTGIASYYHDKFEGRTTANGEVFSQKNITAASNTYPLNCWVRVTNLSNKKTVVVRIIDRMHRLNKRVIDLSRSAASRLGFISKGLTRVKVEYLGKEAPQEAAATGKEEG